MTSSDLANGLGRWDPALAEPRYSQSLERGLTILQCFTPARPVLGIADIADMLGMSRSTTHRYVITLVEMGYLEQQKNRKYFLGLGSTRLGMSALNSMGLREQARPILEDLRRIDCSIGLGVLNGSEVVYVDWRCGRDRHLEAGFGLKAGSRQPFYTNAMGKVLAAYLPPAELEDLADQTQLEAAPPLHPITSQRRLRTELKQVREEGLATEDEEAIEGLVAIAAPVRNENREVVAAVCIQAHSTRGSLEQLARGLSPHLIAAADRISARLGYRRDDEQ